MLRPIPFFGRVTTPLPQLPGDSFEEVRCLYVWRGKTYAIAIGRTYPEQQ